MISYELTLGLGLVSVVMLSGTLDLGGIIQSQVSGGWNIFRAPLGFLLFLISSFAETNRLPFDLPEAEPELVGGYHTEYSSMKFALFFLAEYANMITASAVMSVLFLGGWHVPFLNTFGMDPNACGIYRNCCIRTEDLCIHLFLHVGALVDSEIPLRSVDESWMEGFAAAWHY